MLKKLSNISKVVVLLCFILMAYLHRDRILSALGRGKSSLTTFEKQKKEVEAGEKGTYSDKWGYNYYKVLDEADGNYDRTIFYQRLYSACENYEASLDISDLKVHEEDAWRIYCAMRLDNPELIQTDPGYNYNYYVESGLVYEFNPTIKDKNKYNFDKLRAECEYSVTELRNKINEKYGNNPSKVIIVKEIHDYLAKKKQYKESDFDQTMAGLLSNDYTPVCASYALALKYLCNSFGIQCEIITGNATEGEITGSHMWNIVNYGEPVDYSDPYADYHDYTWYEIDLTWDDPVGGSKNYVRYDYFNVTTAFMRKTHVRDDLYYLTYPIEECYSAEYSYGNCIVNGYFKGEGKKD